jgi:hypothetical protein
MDFAAGFGVEVIIMVLEDCGAGAGAVAGVAAGLAGVVAEAVYHCCTP